MSNHRVLTAGVAVLLAGCGSTAQVVSTRTIDNGGLGGAAQTGVPSGSLGGTTPGLTPTGTTPGTSGAGAQGTTTVGGSNATQGQGPVTVSGGLVLGQGVTATTV